MAARRGRWADYAGGPSPGLSLRTAPWIRDRDIAAVAADTCETAVTISAAVNAATPIPAVN